MTRLVSICFLCRTTYVYLPLENATSLIIDNPPEMLNGFSVRFKMIHQDRKIMILPVSQKIHSAHATQNSRINQLILIFLAGNTPSRCIAKPLKNRVFLLLEGYKRKMIGLRAFFLKLVKF